MSKCAIVLVSGGLDSTTCLGIAKDQGFDLVALSFDYGQRHSVELEAAQRVLDHYEVSHRHVVQMPFFRELGGSALTDEIDVPKHASADEVSQDIPVTYVPARNLVFLAQATAVAELHDARSIFIGVNAVDYSGYPDCRPEFIEAFAQAAQLATKAGTSGGASLAIETPLINLTKAEIIRRGHELSVPYHLTHSCYSPIGSLACGQCDSCLLRLRGFEEAGLEDPVRYAQHA